MASRIQDLVVRIRGEGVEETTEALDEQRESFEETADAAEEQTGKLERFGKRWTGAMATVAAGIGIAAGALANKVPVLGTALDGVDAILTSLGLQLDQLIRDLGLTGDAFFKAAEFIDSLEGAAADAAGALFGLVTAIVGVGAAATAAGLFKGMGLTGGITALGGAAKTAAGLISKLIGSLFGLQIAVGLAAGALGVFVLAKTGALDAIRNFGQQVREVVGGPLADLLLALGGLTGVLPIFAAMGAFAGGVMSGGFSKGVKQAKQVLTTFEKATKRTIDRVKELVLQLQRLREAFADMRSRGVPTGGLDTGDETPGGAGGLGPIAVPGIPGLQSGGMVMDDGLAFLHAGEEVVPSADVDREGGGGHAFAGGGRVIETVVELDGREIARAVGSEQNSGVQNRGRFR